MLETNISVVRPGMSLYVLVRELSVTSANATHDLLEKACGVLRHRHGLAAVRQGSELLVASRRPVGNIQLRQHNWELDLLDTEQDARRLTLDDPRGRGLVPQLVERSFLAQIAHRTELWNLDSPRIFYERDPFQVEDGIAAYRRYEIAGILLEDVGVGIAVDVGTAFFTVENLEYFFGPDVSPEEAKRRERWFANLTGRQEGQKGTLLYDTGQSRTKCYFESNAVGVTCATSGSFGLNGRSYSSLLDYYDKTNRALKIDKDAPVVRVSFRGLPHPVPVAAQLVRVRVMNDDVPDSLSSVDKIDPSHRRLLAQGLWKRLGSRPFGHVAPGTQNGFWRPPKERIIRLALPVLTFGGDQRLQGPSGGDPKAYRDSYRARLRKLRSAGCYSVPAAMPRELYCACPRGHAVAGRRLADDIAQTISSRTGHPITAEIIEYDLLDDAIQKLRGREVAGVALFVLNSEPAAYYEAAFQLSGWRVKRVTEHTLQRYHKILVEGGYDRKARAKTQHAGLSRWRSFAEVNAMELLQLLDAVPYRVDQLGSYESQLVIDVGHDRRHFALSLLVARDSGKKPDFRLTTYVSTKADHQHEEVNAVVLRDQIIDLFKVAIRRPCDPIESILALRDGRYCGKEQAALDKAVKELIGQGRVSANARVDLAELHKDSLRSLRMWQVDGSTTVNVLEGTGVDLNREMVMVATTGSGTLTQGTAKPLLVVANGRCHSLSDAAKAAFDGAQMNWSSPAVAQRLPVALKRTDDELTARAAQEIRRLR
jgi:hypothetical protein